MANLVLKLMAWIIWFIIIICAFFTVGNTLDKFFR